MDYEKAYKEALERARKINSGEGVTTPPDWSVCEVIFPELKESEDEKIRKELLDYLKRFIPHHDIDLVTKSKVWIAWLEKQGKKSWSEEDEEKRKLLISILEVNHPNGCFKVNPINTSNMEVMSTKELVNWLKSIKPNRWKPSEEQIEAIKYFIDFHRPQANASTEGWSEFKHLESLYNDLLKP